MYINIPNTLARDIFSFNYMHLSISLFYNFI